MWVPVRNESSGRAKNRFRMGDLRNEPRALNDMEKPSNMARWAFPDTRFPAT
jgi:hypothetical protein